MGGCGVGVCGNAGCEEGAVEVLGGLAVPGVGVVLGVEDWFADCEGKVCGLDVDFSDKEVVPELPEWIESPAYVAVIVMLFAKLEGGVYVIAHLLLVSMQLFGLKIPPDLPSLHDIMPIMEAEGLDASVTEAVKTIVFPGTIVAGLGVMVVIVAPRTFVDMRDIAKLAECSLSPEYVALIVIVLGGFVGAVYVDVHFGTGMAHDVGLNVPPALSSLKVIDPKRPEGEFDVSVT